MSAQSNFAHDVDKMTTLKVLPKKHDSTFEEDTSEAPVEGGHPKEEL